MNEIVLANDASYSFSPQIAAAALMLQLGSCRAFVTHCLRALPPGGFAYEQDRVLFPGLCRGIFYRQCEFYCGKAVFYGENTKRHLKKAALSGRIRIGEDIL